MHEAAYKTEPESVGWFRRLGRLSRPTEKSEICGGCTRALRAASRFCPHCGRRAFRVGMSEELELPAGRTIAVADDMLLVRYESDSTAARWRDGAGGDRGPVLIVKPQVDPEQVLLPVLLRPRAIATKWGPSYELTPLDVSDRRLRLLVRRCS